MSTAAKFEHVTGSGRHAADLENLLTPRQLEVLALIASGYSYTEIGQRKFWSPYTVQNHASAAVRRTGARSTTHLVAQLVEYHLIRPNPEGDYQPVQDLRIVEE